MYVIFISFCFCFVILASFSLFRIEGFENLQQKELQMANFFFNRRFEFLPAPAHIDTYQFGGSAITYSVCCVFVELADKLYNP